MVSGERERGREMESLWEEGREDDRKNDRARARGLRIEGKARQHVLSTRLHHVQSSQHGGGPRSSLAVLADADESCSSIPQLACVSVAAGAAGISHSVSPVTAL